VIVILLDVPFIHVAISLMSYTFSRVCACYLVQTMIDVAEITYLCAIAITCSTV
jgi:hypothetical protein